MAAGGDAGTRPAASPSLLRIFLIFTKISLTSFGGGLSGWMMREFVQNRRWLTESEFLTGLALAQSFPGVNVVNLSIWVGYRMRGGRGALAGVIGMIVPAMFVAIGIVSVFDRLVQFRTTHVVLAGIAAAAIGLSLQMGLRAAWRSAVSAVPLAIMAITFVAIFALRLPLLLVVLVMAPISIAVAFHHLRTEA